MPDTQPAPKTGAERQRALRARRLRAGMDEVRIWAEADTLKQFAAYQQQHDLTPGAALAQLLNHRKGHEQQ